MGATLCGLCVAGMCVLLLLCNCTNAVKDGCPMRCTDMFEDRKKCALWYALASLDLKEDIKLKQMSCEAYLASSLTVQQEDFVTTDIDGTFVQGLNLTGRVTGGTLAPEIAEFEDFHCSGCNLTGPIPEAWATWGSVQSLDLSNNSLKGRFPQWWEVYSYGSQGIVLNFSMNPGLTGPYLPTGVSWSAGVEVDITNTSVKPPFSKKVYYRYCFPESYVSTKQRVKSNTFKMADECSALYKSNFRVQAGLAWGAFALLAVAIIVVAKLAGARSHKPSTNFGGATRRRLDPEASYMPLPTSHLLGHSAGEFTFVAAETTADARFTDASTVQDRNTSTTAPRHPLTPLLAILAALQLVLGGLHFAERQWLWLWLPLWLLPQLACAAVMHAAMFHKQALWIKASLCYLCIPLVATFMPFMWMFAELKALRSGPPDASLCSVLQVVAGALVLLPLLGLLPCMLLLLLAVVVYSWPSMDYKALKSNVSGVFEQLQVNSFTHITMLHWAVGLVQAPLTALLLTFGYAWWFDWGIYFSPLAQGCYATEFMLCLVNMTLHIALLTHSFQSGKSAELEWLRGRLEAAQLNLQLEVPANNAFIRGSMQCISPSDDLDAEGILRPPDGNGNASHSVHGAVALTPCDQQAGKEEMILGPQSFRAMPQL